MGEARLEKIEGGGNMLGRGSVRGSEVGEARGREGIGEWRRVEELGMGRWGIGGRRMVDG